MSCSLTTVPLAACVGCPSSSVTLQNGVENMLMHYVEEVKGIENVTPEEEADDACCRPACSLAASSCR